MKMKPPAKKTGLILRINDEGQITKTIGCNDARITGISHVQEVTIKDRIALFLGSVSNKYIARLNLD